MRINEVILEGKWWEDTPTLTLYHGTSSAFLDDILKSGIRPPSDSLEAYAEEALEAYIPREEWTPELLKDVHDSCLRIRYSVREDGGDHIYLCLQPESPTGYAESYAAHGGEIAYTVWQVACRHALGDELDNITWREFMKHPPLKPRFHGAKPVILRVEVPREWVGVRGDKFEQVRERLMAAWEKGSPRAQQYSSIEEMLDDALDRVEVRISQTIPPEMITDVQTIGGNLSESVSDDFARWFSGSKCVDAQGRPLKLLHGTAKDFEAFRVPRPRKNDNSYDRDRVVGIFLTPCPDQADYFGRMSAMANPKRKAFSAPEGHRIMPLYCRMLNPLEISYEGIVFKSPDEVIKLAKRAKAEGRDGLIIRNIYDAPIGKPTDLYIPFKAEQVKSVFAQQFLPTNKLSEGS